MFWFGKCFYHQQQMLKSFITKDFLQCAKVVSYAIDTVCCTKHFQHVQTKHHHFSSVNLGRYGHRLVKLWEQPEYTTEPLKVYRTGGRFPVRQNLSDQMVPGKKWTARLGGGLDRQFLWVDHKRLTGEEVQHKSFYQEKVLSIKEDDNRSANIALVAGPLKRRWVLATEGMQVGDIITNSGKAPPESLQGVNIVEDGDAYPVKHIPIGTKICALEFFPGKGAQIARSAGNFGTVVRKEENRVIIQMPTKREIKIHEDCVAVVGRVSNIQHYKVHLGSCRGLRQQGMRPRSGFESPRLSHYRRKPPLKPAVIIGDKLVLQKPGHFEE